jgi:catechol 2,3-dioxygenase-like lactoylglutathione lyase family enzyme
MKKHNTYIFIGIAILLSCSPKNNVSKNSEIRSETILNNQINNKNMKLGAFSVSLNVKDIKASKLFYENLGFNVLAGDIKMNYLIMKNENSLIGLFQGMFENNILTFNPGWDENGKDVESFDDVREIQRRLKDKGIKLESEIVTSTSGPASIVVKDPDGNIIYIDQHR